MIENIKSEKWEQLKTLNGNAKHVPDAVLGLLSEDKNEFEHAYWKLENHVVVQGDLFDSAAVLPKYLEEVVLKSTFKSEVLELLFQIGNGVSLDAELEQCCFGEVLSVLRRLEHHPEIVEAGLSEVIENDLKDLSLIREERKNSA